VLDVGDVEAQEITDNLDMLGGSFVEYMALHPVRRSIDPGIEIDASLDLPRRSSEMFGMVRWRDPSSEKNIPVTVSRRSA
jgi:hypothetical protein